MKREDKKNRNLKFIQNLCLCPGENSHLSCLLEWIESSGQATCNKCHCQYNVNSKPKNFLAYILATKNEQVLLLRRLFHLLNLIHLLLIAIYVFLYFDNPALRFYRNLLLLLAIIRAACHFRMAYLYAQNLFHNYDEWRRRHFTVTVG